MGDSNFGPHDPTTSEEREAHLAALEGRFLQAIDARRRGDVDTAGELIRGILKLEPRLAEPRLELAHILIETGQLREAEEHVREALKTLEAGGQWTEDLDESQLLSLAWGTLGETLRRISDSDEVVFGPVDGFKRLVDEATQCFDRALALDPDNEHARTWSRSLAPLPGVPGGEE